MAGARARSRSARRGNWPGDNRAGRPVGLPSRPAGLAPAPVARPERRAGAGALGGPSQQPGGFGLRVMRCRCVKDSPLAAEVRQAGAKGEVPAGAEAGEAAVLKGLVASVAGVRKVTFPGAAVDPRSGPRRGSSRALEFGRVGCGPARHDRLVGQAGHPSAAASSQRVITKSKRTQRTSSPLLPRASKALISKKAALPGVSFRTTDPRNRPLSLCCPPWRHECFAKFRRRVSYRCWKLDPFASIVLKLTRRASRWQKQQWPHRTPR